MKTYIKGKVALLDIPFFEVPVYGGIENEEPTTKIITIREYIESLGSTIRYNNDSTFLIKGIGFDKENIELMKYKLVTLNIFENVDYFILSHDEALEEIQKDEWVTSDEV